MTTSSSGADLPEIVPLLGTIAPLDRLGIGPRSDDEISSNQSIGGDHPTVGKFIYCSNLACPRALFIEGTMAFGDRFELLMLSCLA
jgi:hypothetical protein